MKRLALLVPALVLLAAGCASTSGAIDVRASGSECTPAKKSFDAGKLTFKVRNTGSQVTELYVYAPGDKVVGEVENIGPGTARTVTVDVAKGSYELACKPGQTGRGIRTTINVTGEGGGSAKASRELAVKAFDYGFTTPAELSGVKAGEKIQFELTNTGAEAHEFEVLGPDGATVGEVGETGPGKKGDGDVTFATAGTYTYRCAIKDHEQRGMKGTFTVSP